MQETVRFGFKESKQSQLELGRRVRTLVEQHGFKSVAAEGFQASGLWLATRWITLYTMVEL